MRFATMIAAIAALWVQPAKAVDLIYSFTGSGNHLEQSGRFPGLPIFVYEGTVTGAFMFDPSLAVASGDGTVTARGQTAAMGGYSPTEYVATISDNRLSLSFSPSSFFDRSDVDIDIWFENGYLSEAFPTAIDFSKVISSHYSFFHHVNIGSGGQSSWGNGSLTSLYSSTEQPAARFSPIPRNLIASVPEPTTWALMLVGFGLMGAALRRRSHVPSLL